MATETTIEQATGDLDPRERAARGRAGRADAPRSSHGEFVPSPSRPDPVDLQEQQATNRVSELIPIRYGRMLASPFTFFRGAAEVMAADLATTPTSGLDVQLCGDAHLSNFGAFASPDRTLVFDINDFDETLRGPWEWDVKRLVASLVIAGRDRGFDSDARRRIALTAVKEYRQAMRTFARMGNLDLWYARLDAAEALRRVRGRVSSKRTRNVRKNIAKARSKDNLRALARLTEVVDGELRIASQPPLIVRVSELLPDADAALLQNRMQELLHLYGESLPPDRRQLLNGYHFVDLARKVVGVGSVGTRAWVILLAGRDGDDPLFLQCKEAGPSALEAYTGEPYVGNNGRRVVEGQRLMQAASDILLGWVEATGIDGAPRDFYVRQLWDWKRSVDVEAMSHKGLAVYGELCAWTLARAHARSGDRVAIAAYLGKGSRFDRAIADFAELYADQNERDYDALLAAAESGRITTAEVL